MARAADTDRLRLDNPHWPLVLMLVLTQAAAGIFLLGASGRLAGFSVDVRAYSAAGFIMLCAGLSASVMHLGRPSKAWRAFLGWRQSWLSREVIALNVFAGIALLFTVSALASEWPSGLWRDACSALVAGSGVLGVFTSVMVYVDVQRPFWCAGRVFAQFYGTTLLLGLSIAVVLLVWLKGLDPIAQSAALGALVLNIALFSWRRLELRFALRDETRPIHFNARVISELLPRTRALGSTLCVASSMLWVAVFVDFLSAASLWAMLAALAAFVSEMNERYVFFTASGSKRMPGGIGS